MPTPNRRNPALGFLAAAAISDIGQIGAGDAAVVTRMLEASRPRTARAMTNTITVRDSTAFTNRNQQYGKIKKRKLQLMRALAANITNVYWQFKGLGKPYCYGFYNMSKFWFSDTEQYVACPLYMMDLTSTNNIAPTLSINYKTPLLRMYKNRTDGTVVWRPVLAQQADGTIIPLAGATLPNKGSKTVSTVSAVADVAAWQPLNYQASTTTSQNIYPYARDYINSIDIYLNLFAARNYPTRFKVDVVSLPDWACPYDANDDGLAEDVACADKAMHDAYWTNEMVTWTVHPLDVQRGTKSGGQPALNYRSGPFGMYQSGPRSHIKGPKFFSFDPKDTSVTDVSGSANVMARMHREKITLYPGREVDLNYRQRTMYSTDTAGSLRPVVDPSDGFPDTIVRNADTYTVSPKPEQRMYLMIQSTDFVESTAVAPYTVTNCPTGGNGVNSANVWGGRVCTDGVGALNAQALTDIKYAPSFDLNVIKCCRRVY